MSQTKSFRLADAALNRRQLLMGWSCPLNGSNVGGSGQKRVSVAYRRSHIARRMASLSVPIAKFSLDLGFEQWAGLAFGYNQHEIARGTAERNIQLGPRPRRISETTLIAGQQHYVVKLQALLQAPNPRRFIVVAIKGSLTHCD